MIVTPSRLTIALAGLGVPTLLLAAGLGAHAATRPPPTPRARTVPRVARVAIQGYAFAPKTLTVAPGTTVTWTNKDSDIHSIVSDTAVFTASDDLHTGKSFTHTFTKVGTYTYHCGQHAFMTGAVIVKSPAHARR